MIIAQLFFNMSDFMGEIMRYAFAPYLVIFGNMFWGIFFGFIGAGIYAGSERSWLPTIGYLIIIGVIFSAILDFFMIAIFGLILAFLVTVLLYNVFVEARQ